MNIEASAVLNFLFFYNYFIAVEILIVKIVTLISIRIFQTNFPYMNFMKIRPKEAALFHAGRWTDRRDEANSSFSQCYKKRKNHAMADRIEIFTKKPCHERYMTCVSKHSVLNYAFSSNGIWHQVIKPWVPYNRAYSWRRRQSPGKWYDFKLNAFGR